MHLLANEKQHKRCVMDSRTLFSVVACATLTACGGGPVVSPPPATVELTSARIDVDYVDASPTVEVESAPRVVFQGRPTFYYQNHWYYRREGGRWRYYRTEPLGLVEERHRLEAQPPPHHHEEGHHDR
jgi:hypothetical protein